MMWLRDCSNFIYNNRTYFEGLYGLFNLKSFFYALVESENGSYEFFISKNKSRFQNLHSQINFSKIFKKISKPIVGTVDFRPHKQGRRAKALTNLENRISSIPVYIRLDGATMILARGPVLTASDQQR